MSESSNRVNHICFLSLYLSCASWWKPATGRFHSSEITLRRSRFVRSVEEEDGQKELTVVLYFFLLRDAPSSPSVLIGSGEHPCAGPADVNQAWRTSAAGTNIPTSLSFTRPLPSLNSEFQLLNLFMWFSHSFFPFVRLQHQCMGIFFLFAYCYQVILPLKDYSFCLHVWWRSQLNSLHWWCKHLWLCRHGHFHKQLQF